MAPINISIEGVGGVRLSSDSALDKWLDKNKVQCLINKDGYQVVDFDSLENEGVYKLGPPLLQQQQQVSLDKLSELLFLHMNLPVEPRPLLLLWPLN